MKKIKTLLETTAFIAALPLLVFAEINHNKNNRNQYENVSLIKNAGINNQNAGNTNFDNNLPALLTSRVIIINY